MRKITVLLALAMMLFISQTEAAKLGRMQEQMSLAQINETSQDDQKKTAGQLDTGKQDSIDEKTLNSQDKENQKANSDSNTSSKDNNNIDEKNKDNSKGSEEVVENNPKISPEEEQTLQQLGDVFQGLQDFEGNEEAQINKIIEKTQEPEQLVKKEEVTSTTTTPPPPPPSPKESITEFFGDASPQSSELSEEEKELSADLQEITEKQLSVDFKAISVNSLTNSTTLEESLAKNHPTLSQSKFTKGRFNWGVFVSSIVVIGFIAVLLFAAQMLGKRQHQRKQSKQLNSSRNFIRDYGLPQKIDQEGYYPQGNYYQEHSEYAQPLI